MQFPEFVEARPDAMMGKPCLKGTRIPAYLILEKLAAGEHPATEERIRQAIRRALPFLQNIEMAGRLAVVDDDKISIRRQFFGSPGRIRRRLDTTQVGYGASCTGILYNDNRRPNG